MKRALLVSAVAVLSIASASGAARAQSSGGAPRPVDLAASIDQFQAGFDAANRLSGVLLVMRGDEVLIHEAYGASDAASGTRIQLSTPFAIASITKILTLVTVFELVREGRLSLDDPLSRWIPDFPEADSITVGNLVNHRAGIRHRVTTPEEELQHHSAAGLVKLAGRYPLVFRPGSQSAYSSAGFAVLARVVELVNGRSFAEVLEARIFLPAGMKDSYDLTRPDGREPPASPFLPAHGRLVPAPARDLSFLAGGGSIVSTADDMLRLVRALREGKLGGVKFEDLAPRGTARWVGATNAYFCWVDVVPADSLTTIYLSNTWGGAGPALRDALPAMIRGEHPAPPAIPAEAAMPDKAVLEGYRGQYQTRPGAVMSVVPQGDDLLFEDNYLVPIGEDQFWQPSVSMSLRFIRDETGVVVAIETQDGKRWPRVNAAD